MIRKKQIITFCIIILAFFLVGWRATKYFSGAFLSLSGHTVIDGLKFSNSSGSLIEGGMLLVGEEVKPYFVIAKEPISALEEEKICFAVLANDICLSPDSVSYFSEDGDKVIEIGEYGRDIVIGNENDLAERNIKFKNIDIEIINGSNNKIIQFSDEAQILRFNNHDGDFLFLIDFKNRLVSFENNIAFCIPKGDINASAEGRICHKDGRLFYASGGNSYELTGEMIIP